MDRLSFGQLPLVVRVAVGLAFNNAWWSIEEFVVDRRGLWKYMPYYRVANVCIWDVTVAIVSVLWLWRLSRSSKAIDKV